MKEFVEAPRKIYELAKDEGRLFEGMNLDELKILALEQENVVLTGMGSIAAYSEPMSRAAPKTKNNIDQEFGEEERELALQAVEYLRNCNVVSLDTPVGSSNEITARFLMPEKYAQLAYGLKLLFGEPSQRVVENPAYKIVFFTDDSFEANKKITDVRSKDVIIRLWMGEERGEQVKICRNTTYLGEGKKGVFQFEDWRVKEIDEEGLFLHAGVRRDWLWIYDYKQGRPELKDKVSAISGLTATGKTSSLCRRLARIPKEKWEMIGDDGGTFKFDGSFSAFEKSGIYAKTDGIDKEHPEILRAAEAIEAYLENVQLGQYPYIPRFSDVSITKNGRAVILRKNLGIASRDIEVEKVDNIILLTRNPLVNVVSKLTPEQAVMQFIYGESIETSGTNPVEAGKFTRVFFLDPFVVGDRLKHALIFYDLLKKNRDISCYLSNTGTIGQDGLKITLRDSLAVYNDILRESIKFSTTPDQLGYYYPIQCDRANLDKLTALDKFEEDTLKARIKDFLEDRRKYLKDFEEEYGPIPSKIKESLRYK